MTPLSSPDAQRDAGRLGHRPQWVKQAWGAALVSALLVTAAPSPAAAETEAGEQAVPPLRVALLPTIWITPPVILTNPPAQVVATRLKASRAPLQLLDLARSASAAGERGPSCPEDLSCLSELGAALEADRVLVIRVGKLGDTTVIRLSVVDVKRAALEQTLQEVVAGEDEQQLQAGLEVLAQRYAQPLEPPAESPWYARWWVWGVGGAVVLALTGAAVAVAAIALAPEEGEPPDVIITPP